MTSHTDDEAWWLLSVLALPFGFIKEGVAVVAGVYGLYFALPPWWRGALTSFGVDCRPGASERSGS